MRGWTIALGVALCLVAVPSLAHEGKRTDACGCHHQWGMRHCHPQKKTPRCEAPVRSEGTREGRHAHSRTSTRPEAVSL